MPEKFLYNSPKEQTKIRTSALNEVVDYGKIPRKPMQQPTYFGGSTSPEFMYILKTAREPFQSVSDEDVSAHPASQLKRYNIVTMIEQVVAQWHQ